MALSTLCKAPGLLAASLALGAATALLPGTAHQQYCAAVVLLAGTRAFAAWCNAAWHGRGPHIAYCTWLMHCSYALCSILRSRWNVGTMRVMEHWVQPVIAGCQFSTLAAHGTLDWASRRKQLHWPQLLLMNTTMAIVAAYPAWAKCQQQRPPCSYADYALSAALWATAVPILLIELLPRLLVAAVTVVRGGASVPAPAARTGAASIHCQAWLPAVKAALSWLGLKESSIAEAAPVQAGEAKPMVLYQSAVQPRVKAVAKIHGPIQLHDLPHDLAIQLQTSLGPSGFDLLNLAARTGCVCLSLDLIQRLLPTIKAPASPSEADLISGDTQDPHTEDDAWRVSQMLLPALDAAVAGLQQADNERGTKHDITLQVDRTRMTAKWDVTASSWQVTLADPNPAPSPRLQLGFLQQLPGSSSGSGFPHMPPGPGCMPRASGTRPPTATSPTSKAPAAVQHAHLHMVQVLAQLMATDAASLITTSELSSIVGWEAPHLAGQHEHVDPTAFRLLACCNGSYVSTHVLEVMEQYAADGQHPAIKVELQVPDRLLPRHHVHGCPVGIVPLVLELWQGDNCLNTATLLVQLPSFTDGRAPAVVASSWLASQPACWWWGSKSSTVQRVLQELARVAAGMAASANSRTTSVSWHAFQEDLVLWLQHLRCITVQAGFCTADAHAASQPEPWFLHPAQVSLSAAEMVTAGTAFTRFAQEHGMRHTLKMLRQQQRIVRAWSCQQQPQALTPPVQHGSGNQSDEVASTHVQCCSSPQLQSAALTPPPQDGNCHTTRRRQLQRAAMPSATTQCSKQSGSAINLAASRNRTAAAQQSPKHVAVTWCDVRDALLGSHCEQCEMRQYTAVAELLSCVQVSSIQLVVSGALVLSGMVRVAVCTHHQTYTESGLILIWVLLRLRLLTQQFAMSRLRMRQAPAALYQSLVWAFLSRLATHLLIGLGVLPTETRLRLGTVLVNYVLLTFAEQAQVTLLLPRPIATVVTTADLLIYLLLCARIGCAHVYLLPLLLPVAWLPRIVPDVMLRSRLRYT